MLPRVPNNIVDGVKKVVQNVKNDNQPENMIFEW